MNSSKITKLVGISLFIFSVTISCSKKPLLDNNSEVFTKYTEVETKLSNVSRHPDQIFQKLFDQFVKDQNWNYNLLDIPNGIYESYSIPDKYGYVHYINFEVKNSNFINIYYNEYLGTDIKTEFLYGGADGKRNDANYAKQMKQYGNKSELSEAYPLMEEELLKTQDPIKVDGISGASLALYRFRIMIMKALYEYRSKTTVNQKAYSFGKKIKGAITK